jgi:hypothetical protein
VVIFFHARLRVHWASGIPHALTFRGGNDMHDLGALAPRECGVVFFVIASAAKQSILSFSWLHGLLRCARNDDLKAIAPYPQASSLGLTGRPSIPETPMIEPKGRGVLDRPVKPDDDTSL